MKKMISKVMRMAPVVYAMSFVTVAMLNVVPTVSTRCLGFNWGEEPEMPDCIKDIIKNS